jgi:hypothetical protein
MMQGSKGEECYCFIVQGPRCRIYLLHCPTQGLLQTTKKAKDALNLHFIPKKNTPYARHTFRNTKQQPGETVTSYYTRLCQIVKDCDYGADKDNQIRDQILSNTTNEYLQRKLLEEGDDLTLTKTLETARLCEEVEKEMASLKMPSQQGAAVNYVKKKPTYQKPSGAKPNGAKPKYTPGNKTPNFKPGKCFRCGTKGHWGSDPTCPARGKTCKKCGGRDHFDVCCRTKKHSCKHVEEVTEQDYGFTVSEVLQVSDKTTISVGGVDLEMIVDSGASTNIVDSDTWSSLKEKKIKVSSSEPQSQRRLYAYGSTEPIPIKGTFSCNVEIGDQACSAEFVVIKGKGPALLGKRTAIELGILHIGPVHHVESQCKVPSDIMKKYSSVFQGVGKLKDRQIQLHVDQSVPPVAQPLRRTPFQLKRKVEQKVKELIDMDIIEPVKSATPWVSPVVIVPKANNDIRICVDMRRANEAINRVRHPIPTTDEVLQSMNGSTVFTKLDLKMGYHQLELEPSSRDITVFSCSAGVYRYKRLSFGVNSASEQYQYEIQRVLTGLEGALNISDDIIIHGKGDEAHDKNMEAAMKRIQESGLTLNPDKCQFRMTKLVFMGILASEKGIGPTEARVEAVNSAREPESASEVRSFLGLVNFSARFIPNLATIAEPLRRLTKKDVPFKFGEDERGAFNELKKALAECGTLSYYDPDAPTQIFTDASPVGLGAVLIQKQGGEWVAVNYASRSLTDCEGGYSQTEKEALGVVWGCEKFHQYVYGMNEFDLITDHKALEQIYGPRSRPCARIERWVLRLQPYRFKVKYRPGNENIADCLSRLTSKSESHDHGADEYVNFVTGNAVPIALTIAEIEAASETDGELIALRECLLADQPYKCDKKYKAIVQELCVSGSLVLRGARIVMPAKLRPCVVSLAHEGHMGVVATKQRLRSKVWWPGIDHDVEKYC